MKQNINFMLLQSQINEYEALAKIYIINPNIYFAVILFPRLTAS